MRSFFIFFLSISATFSLAQPGQETSETNYKFNEVLEYVNMMYVDEVDGKALTEAAIVAMLEKLDPHSTYIPKEEVDDANEKINGNFVGIGIRFQIHKDTLQVVATIPGGPSEKIGLLAGDKIIEVEGETIAGIGLKNKQVRERLLGDKGTKVRMKVLRKKNEKPLDFTITRDVIPVHSVDSYYMLSAETGYIRLNSFSRSSLEEVRTALIELNKAGMKNLVFDLQGNGGGLLYTAKDIADEFLSGEKLIVYSEGRAQPRSDLKAGASGMWEKGRLVILTDEYSASASEIVAGAIQDWDRGLIIGRRSYGKGLVQRPIELTDGSQIRLTIARYFTPSGRYIQKPYSDLDSYKKDLLDRYLNGELQHQDSIKFPDSLKFNTLVKKRTVYGGGGIMPDVFVPLDTTKYTDLYSSIIRGGFINGFTLEYIEKNRDVIKKDYADFSSFKSSYTINENSFNEFLSYVAQEDSTLIIDDQELEESAYMIKLQLKAKLAQDLWGYNEFFQIYNENNDILKKALDVIESEQYLSHKINQH